MAQPCPSPAELSATSSAAPIPANEPRLSLAPAHDQATEAVPAKAAPAQTAKAANGKIHYRRVWLNRPGHHGSAHIISEVEIERVKGDVDITASFLISDCTRNVTIDCDIWPGATAAQRHNAVRKARLVRDAAAAFCEALESAVAEQDAARAARRRPRRRKTKQE